MYILGSLLQII